MDAAAPSVISPRRRSSNAPRWLLRPWQPRASSDACGAWLRCRRGPDQVEGDRSAGRRRYEGPRTKACPNATYGAQRADVRAPCRGISPCYAGQTSCFDGPSHMTTASPRAPLALPFLLVLLACSDARGGGGAGGATSSDGDGAAS